MKAKFELFSCGLYSSWCFWYQDRVLFDCGEGCATYLKNRVYAVEKIFLSHTHGDHVLGLPSFIGIRNSARGDKEKPLAIYYPRGESINDLRAFIESRHGKYLTFDINWIGIKDDVYIELENNRSVDVFPVQHTKYSLGYRILERRSRLKKKYAGQDIPALLRSGETNKNDLHDYYYKNLFSYTLDSYDFDPINIEGADHWVADSTFLKPEDRDAPTHMTYEQVCCLAHEYNVAKTYAAHVSPRYNLADIKTAPKAKGVILVDSRNVFREKA